MDREVADKTLVWGICAALIAAVLAAYEPVREADFVDYDDYQYIVANPIIKKGLTVEGVKWAFTSFHASNWHPVTWLSHMLDCELFGPKAMWHHFVNILFHAANSVLVFTLLYRMTGALWRSALATGLFAVHPMHVESVAWVAQRKDVLSVFFGLLAIMWYVRYVRRRRLGDYAVMLVFYCLCLMSKPMLVSLPLLLLLIDRWPLQRREQKREDTFGRSLLEKVPLFTLAAASCVVTFCIQRGGGAMAGEHNFPLKMRLANAATAYISYIGKLIYPKGLAVLYPLRMDGIPAGQVAAAAGALAGITIIAILLGRRKQYLLTGWLWYVISLLPVIGIVQVGVQSMADRYSYIPSLGIFIIAVWGGWEIAEKIRIPKFITSATAVAIIVIFVLCSRVQAGYWKDNFCLFGRAIAVTENNYIMHNNYGIALMNRGSYDEAIEHFRKVLEVAPGYIRAKANIGIALRKQNKVDEAIECFREVLETEDDHAEVWNDLGRAYAYKGDGQAAIDCYKKAIELKPDYAQAWNNWGMVLKDTGKTEEAMEKFRKAQELLRDE